MNDALFGLDPATDTTIVAAPPLPISEDQVRAIRKGFVAAGIESQDARRTLVQSCTVRPIDSLKALTAVEAHRVLNRLRANGQRKPSSGGSAWDNREEDTWIDKL